MDDQSSTGSTSPDTFWGHVTAGIFLIAFGATFLGLTVWRWTRLQETTEDSIRFQVFLERHVPEQNDVVLIRTAKALICSTLFGLLYEGLGARFLNHDLHPDWTVLHYTTHLTLTSLYLWVGWTGLLEYWKLVPQDSIRAAVAVALLGETLLWHEHATTKQHPVDGKLHDYLALISALTALCIIWNLILLDNPKLSFTLYTAGFLGLFWQGLWFLVAAFHQRSPFASTEDVTSVFCLCAVGLFCALQVISIRLHRSKGVNSSYQPISKLQESPITALGQSSNDGFID